MILHRTAEEVFTLNSSYMMAIFFGHQGWWPPPPQTHIAQPIMSTRCYWTGWSKPPWTDKIDEVMAECIADTVDGILPPITRDFWISNTGFPGLIRGMILASRSFARKMWIQHTAQGSRIRFKRKNPIRHPTETSMAASETSYQVVSHRTTQTTHGKWRLKRWGPETSTSESRF